MAGMGGMHSLFAGQGPAALTLMLSSSASASAMGCGGPSVRGPEGTTALGPPTRSHTTPHLCRRHHL